MAHTYTQRPKTKEGAPLRPLALVLFAVATVIVAIIVLELTDTTHIFHAAPVAKTGTIKAAKPKLDTNKDKDGAPTSNAPTPAPTDTGNSEKDPGGTLPAPSGAAPNTPHGSFVSNHTPNLDGDPSPSREQSVCTTTPGATCVIQFTKGDLTRTLETQTTSSDGDALWTWDVKQAGFTEGTWQILVTATLNGKTATAQDSFKVGP